MEVFIPRDLPDAKLLCVPPHMVEHWLPIVAPLIAKAWAEFGMDIPAWLLPDLREGRALIWLAVDRDNKIMCALVTSIVTRHAGKVCKLMACGGERMEIWSAFHLEIERYAKGEGCVKVAIEGRRGWERALSGYRISRVTLEKVL